MNKLMRFGIVILICISLGSRFSVSRSDDLALIGEPSLLVAASDALISTISRADYVCDGESDQVEIQQALNDLPDSGGRVVLSEGQFNTDASIVISQSITLAGVGDWATKINLSYDPDFAGLNVTGGVYWSYIEDLVVVANAPITPTHSVDGINISGSMVELKNVYVKYAARNGIYAHNFVHLRMINVYSRYGRTGSGAYLRRAVIQNDGANQIYIEGGNYLGNKVFGLWLYHTANTLVQMVNFGGNGTAGLGITGGTNTTVQNCGFEGNKNGIYIRTGSIGIGRSTAANEVVIRNSVFNLSQSWDIDAFDTTGIRIEDCMGNSIRLGSSVSEIIYDHSIFGAETISGSYWGE